VPPRLAERGRATGHGGCRVWLRLPGADRDQFLVRTATHALLSHRPAAGRAPRPPQELMRGGISTNGRARWPGERAAAASADEDAMHKNEFIRDRKSTRLNSSHQIISYAVFCLKKKKQQ